MNCKPGDLAVVINAIHIKENIGRIVEVLRLAVPGERVGRGRVSDKERSLGWVVRPAGGGKMNSWAAAGFFVSSEEALCLDSNLRPIRDPGEDAQDESLTWLPVPTREGVPA